MQVKLRYIKEELDRHGNVRVYFRKRGCRKVRIRERIGTPEFHARYQELVTAAEAGALDSLPATNGRPVPGTWRALCVDYFGSATFRRLADSTQRARRRVLESTFDEPIAPGAAHHFRDMPLVKFGSKAVKVLRDRKASHPEAANQRVKSISTVFSWALEDERPGVTRNPARDVARIRTASSGWHTWSIEEVEQFEARHQVGTKARLAFALLLYTGVRRSDVVRLGQPHMRGGRLIFTAWKNRERQPVEHDLPVLPELAEILAASELGEITFLTTSRGVPFTAAGFGNWFRDRCNEAGLPQCSAHGLRKAGSTRAAENGATAHQLMAMFGWTTLAQAETYTRTATRRTLAASGMPLILGRSGGK